MIIGLAHNHMKLHPQASRSWWVIVCVYTLEGLSTTEFTEPGIWRKHWPCWKRSQPTLQNRNIFTKMHCLCLLHWMQRRGGWWGSCCVGAKTEVINKGPPVPPGIFSDCMHNFLPLSWVPVKQLLYNHAEQDKGPEVILDYLPSNFFTELYWLVMITVWSISHSSPVSLSIKFEKQYAWQPKIC